jgi:hypothetical protein
MAASTSAATAICGSTRQGTSPKTGGMGTPSKASRAFPNAAPKRCRAKVNGVKVNFPLHLKECAWGWRKDFVTLKAEFNRLTVQCLRKATLARCQAWLTAPRRPLKAFPKGRHRRTLSQSLTRKAHQHDPQSITDTALKVQRFSLLRGPPPRPPRTQERSRPVGWAILLTMLSRAERVRPLSARPRSPSPATSGIPSSPSAPPPGASSH